MCKIQEKLLKVPHFIFKSSVNACIPLFISSINIIEQFFSCMLSKSESVEFLLIESVICLFTDSSMKNIFH